MTYSPKKRILSTIGAEGLNCCVRDGNRCDSFAIITRILGNLLPIYLFESISQNYTVKYSRFRFLQSVAVIIAFILRQPHLSRAHNHQVSSLSFDFCFLV